MIAASGCVSLACESSMFFIKPASFDLIAGDLAEMKRGYGIGLA